jgi:hypothetical protein
MQRANAATLHKVRIVRIHSANVAAVGTGIGVDAGCALALGWLIRKQTRPTTHCARAQRSKVWSLPAGVELLALLERAVGDGLLTPAAVDELRHRVVINETVIATD